MVLENPFPPDERVENEIDILLRNGFSITLLCTGKGNAAENEDKGTLDIRRVRIPSFIYKAGALALELPFYFRFWRRHIKNLLLQTHFDAMHLHDLPLAKVCSELAAEFSIPLVFDYHENRPEIMKMYHHVNSFPGNLLISPERWQRYQRRESPKADRLILVTDEAKEYYAKNYGLDKNRIVVLPNFIVLSRFRKMAPGTTIKPEGDEFVVAYFGDTGLRRGTMTLIDAADKLKNNKVRFLVIGTSREQNVLENEILRRGLTNITLTGWLAPSEAMKMISMADAGACPFLRNIHHDTTFANKMFQYMALAKPVIVSDCTAQAAFVTREKCGLVFTAGDTGSFCDMITSLSDRSLYETLSRNAINCVNEKYNWENFGGRLVDMYNGIASSVS